MGHFDKKSVVLACAVMLLGSLGFADKKSGSAEQTNPGYSDTANDTGRGFSPVSPGSEMKSQAEGQKHSYDRSAVITFMKGKSDLTKADQKRVESLIKDVGADKIDRVEVTAWSDKSFPVSGKDL